MASDPGPAASVLQLRIALRGLSPPVWRRVLVPEHLTLGQLHHVFQVVMGWADEHLHTDREFCVCDRRLLPMPLGQIQMPYLSWLVPIWATQPVRDRQRLKPDHHLPAFSALHSLLPSSP